MDYNKTVIRICIFDFDFEEENVDGAGITETELEGMCLLDFETESEEELKCKKGDCIMLVHNVNLENNIVAKNVRTGEYGIIPLSYKRFGIV